MKLPDINYSELRQTAKKYAALTVVVLVPLTGDMGLPAAAAHLVRPEDRAVVLRSAVPPVLVDVAASAERVNLGGIVLASLVRTDVAARRLEVCSVPQITVTGPRLVPLAGDLAHQAGTTLFIGGEGTRVSLAAAPPVVVVASAVPPPRILDGEVRVVALRVRATVAA